MYVCMYVVCMCIYVVCMCIYVCIAPEATGGGHRGVVVKDLPERADEFVNVVLLVGIVLFLLDVLHLDARRLDVRRVELPASQPQGL